MTSNDNTSGHRIQDHSNEPSSSKLVPNVSLPADTTDPSLQDLELLSSPITAEPKNIKEAMADHAWIEAMQEKLHQFDRLNVWELVDKPFGKTAINLKWL
ncbi:hypothetical protein Tco_0732356 [Tanacetum coccineum]